MMSMAGGWVFLTVSEAFTLRGRDYRLPGIGSYMHEAIAQGATGAMVAGAAAMVVMIVAVDQLFWRPIVVWSQRFKMDQTAEADRPQSWVLSLLQRSRLFSRVCRDLQRSRIPSLRRIHATRPAPAGASPSAGADVKRSFWRLLVWTLRWLVVASVGVGAAWGAWSLLRLVRALPLHEGATHDDWVGVLAATGASFLRTTAAVVVAALWALPAGILIGRSARWAQRLQPVVQFVASFPAPMLSDALSDEPDEGEPEAASRSSSISERDLPATCINCIGDLECAGSNRMFRRLFAALIAFVVYGAVPSDADAVTDDAGAFEDGKHSRLVESRISGPSLAESGQPHLASEFAGAGHTPLVADSFRQYVGVITLATNPSAAATEAALVPALSACRDRGDLKIHVILGGCEAELVRQMCEHHGFMFSKRRQAGNERVMEFYTDLYYQPPPGHSVDCRPRMRRSCLRRGRRNS
jgi:hypothetical protein